MGSRRRDHSFMDKPESGWLHDDTPLSAGQGLFYSFPVVYVGSIVVSQSLRPLSVIDQTALMRDLIHTVATRVGLRKPQSQISPGYLSKYLSGPVTPAEVDVNLNISSDGLMIVPVQKDDTGDYVEVGMLQFSPMRFISLAAGGEDDDYELICYVGKNDVGLRECFVFDCGQLSDEVLETFGQAFVLANGSQQQKKKDNTYDRPYQAKAADKSIYERIPAADPTYASLSREQQRARELDNTYFEVDDDQYIVTEPSVRRKKNPVRVVPYDNPSSLPSAPQRIKHDHPYDNPQALLAENVYGEPDEPGYGEPSLLPDEGQYGETHAPQPDLGYSNPMYTEPQRESDPAYDSLPVDEIRSQYQHVDALPPLSDDDLEVEDKSELVRKLNNVDHIRRAVRGHVPGYLDVKDETGDVRPDRPAWKYMPANSLKRVSLDEIAAHK
ncbi:hypothetical protein PTSG_03868 [Salpingoeca rosetta]|uniref:PID domain-containing protein n=1 Tax=Salpingoeca rosetta (strain ATCC 50818 / BSB-021) TaxID=946362 RepID=F2U5M0_SALR5|nr:uncharacterized protein PTSG_03868 [Salpingoeca rosetta]EGD83236.1 hypothetical protein PTSG_03868 [Salpingoeca rosetta]|eukprot:XP_004995600.1 hypothetical protein PTSG_03868 [Salpingoeca rosetta]